MAVHPSFRIIPGPVEGIVPLIENYKVGKIYDETGSRKRVLVETIEYQDMVGRTRLLPHISALCNLLSSDSIRQQQCILPFYGLHHNIKDFYFELVYDFPISSVSHREGVSSPSNPISLYELLTVGNARGNSPPLESRLILGLELAKSLAALHDANWFHKDLTSHNVLFCPPSAPTDITSQSTDDIASRPFLVGFQRSRSGVDDLTEGPQQIRAHHRCHDPRYISATKHPFQQFRPQFDYYSFGILLVEIGLWSTIEAVMGEEYANVDDHAFCTAVLDHKLATLSFSLGSGYVDIVTDCLSGLGLDAQHDQGLPTHRFSAQGRASGTVNPNYSLLFKQKVVMPVQSFSAIFDCVKNRPLDKKRKRDREEIASLKRRA